MDSFEIKFGPESAIYKYLRQEKDSPLFGQSEVKEVVYKFKKNRTSEGAGETTRDESLILWHVYARSPSVANLVLDEIAENVRTFKPIPEYYAILLAGALDRVREEKEAVNFFCGKQQGKGHPVKDGLEDMHIYTTIEAQYAELGRLDTTKEGKVGAYDAANEILKADNLRQSNRSLKDIRSRVHNRARDDLMYLDQLVEFLSIMGYQGEIVF